MPLVDPEKRKAYRAAYYQRNRDKIRARTASRYVNDKVNALEYAALYRIRNRAKVLVTKARRRALRDGIPFDLQSTDICIPDVCPVLGIPLNKKARGRFSDASPTLDKHDPALGYVRGNVVVMSHRANTLKSNATFEEIEALYFYMKRMEMFR